MLSVLLLGKCLTHYCLNKIKLLLGIRIDECVSYPLHSTGSGKGAS